MALDRTVTTTTHITARTTVSDARWRTGAHVAASTTLPSSAATELWLAGAENGSEESFSTLEVVGIAVGSCVLVISLIICLVKIRKRCFPEVGNFKLFGLKIVYKTGQTPENRETSKSSRAMWGRTPSTLDSYLSKSSRPGIESVTTLASDEILSEAGSDEASIGPQRSYSGYSSIQSMRRKYVDVESCDEAAFEASLKCELARWPAKSEGGASTEEVIMTALNLLYRAGDGVLMVVAPISELRRLSTQSTDDGYMTQRVRGMHISSEGFKHHFFDFTEHTDTDRWPEDHRDVEARGRPKDGAFLMLPCGKPAKCAAKIIALPLGPRQWAGYGTRHETGLAVSALLSFGVILIRSSSGKVHALLARDRGTLALRPCWLEAVPQCHSNPTVANLKQMELQPEADSRRMQAGASDSDSGMQSELRPGSSNAEAELMQEKVVISL